MTSKTIICAIAAASFSFASLSFADDDDRRGSGRESSRSEQRGDRDRHGHDSDRRDHRDKHKHHGHRGHDRYDVHSEQSYGARGPYFYRGGRIPQEYRARQYVVTNWQGHRLNAPPRGQQWVQVGSDYVLIAIATGIIAQLVLNQ